MMYKHPIHIFRGWSSGTLYDLQKLYLFSAEQRIYTRQLARLRSGFLIREMLSHFTERMKKNHTSKTSLWIYSAHDITITSLLNVFGVFEVCVQDGVTRYVYKNFSFLFVLQPLGVPNYSSGVLFELHKSHSGYHIEVYHYTTKHKNNDFMSHKPLFIPGCGTWCSVSKMLQSFWAMIPHGDFDTECENNN